MTQKCKKPFKANGKAIFLNMLFYVVKGTFGNQSAEEAFQQILDNEYAEKYRVAFQIGIGLAHRNITRCGKVAIIAIKICDKTTCTHAKTLVIISGSLLSASVTRPVMVRCANTILLDVARSRKKNTLRNELSLFGIPFCFETLK